MVSLSITNKMTVFFLVSWQHMCFVVVIVIVAAHGLNNVVRPNPNAVRIVCDQLKEIPKKLRKQYSPWVTEGFSIFLMKSVFGQNLEFFLDFSWTFVRLRKLWV